VNGPGQANMPLVEVSFFFIKSISGTLQSY